MSAYRENIQINHTGGTPEDFQPFVDNPINGAYADPYGILFPFQEVAKLSPNTDVFITSMAVMRNASPYVLKHQLVLANLTPDDIYTSPQVENLASLCPLHCVNIIVSYGAYTGQ